MSILHIPQYLAINLWEVIKFPLGKYPTFDACKADYLKNGYTEEESRRICGSIQEQIEGASERSIKTANQAQSYEENNRTYLKVWLIDGSLNKNDWGVTPESIPANINTAIGKPLLIYQNTGKEPDFYDQYGRPRRRIGAYDHPYLAGADSIDHALAYQDLFRVGTFIDVFESNTKKGEWWGIAEITDEDTRRAMREDRKLPLYVSPMIHLQDLHEPENAHSHWSLIHSAIVGEPAFGADKAYISGECSGSQQTCMLQLRKAAIANTENNDGKPKGCGFCRYKAVKEIQASIRSASVSAPIPKESSKKSLSSLDKISEHLQFRNSKLSGDNNQDNNKDGQQQQTNDRSESQNQDNTTQEKTQTKTKPLPTNPQTGAPGQTQETEITQQESTLKRKSKSSEEEEEDNKNKNTKQASLNPTELLQTVQSQAAVIKDLQLQIGRKDADIKTQESINNQFQTRLATLEQERAAERESIRKASIEQYVNTAPAYRLLSASERKTQIENFVNGNMDVDVIKNLMAPINDSIAKQEPMLRQASYSQIRSRNLNLGSADSSKIETRSASAASTTTTETPEEAPFWMVRPNGLNKNSVGMGGTG